MAAMNPTGDRPKQIALLGHRNMEETSRLAESVAQYMTSKGIECEGGGLSDVGAQRSLDEATDLIVALGGDGTMLRAGALGAAAGIPVLGINLGRLGFLMEVHRDGWREAFDRLLAGDYWIESRMRVTVGLERGDEELGPWKALNECVVGRGRTGRPIRLRAELDGHYLAQYVADALICSTATGSTAYAMAAGGPILPPALRNLLLIPVAPHLSLDRAIVLPEGTTVRLTVVSEQEADLSSDGQVREALLKGDSITIRASHRDAQFVRFKDPGYFFRNLTTHMNHFTMKE